MPDGAASTAGPLARLLFEHALLRGRFTLRSGLVTDRYFDKYRVSCEPRLLGPVAGRLADLLRDHAHDATRIVAPELGAVPLATALSLELGIPFAIVRSQGKRHGTANLLEGPVEAGERAVLVEDVVTTGGAAVEALHVARGAGLQVDHALCLLDRDEGGRAALARVDVELHALLDAGQLAAAADAGVGLQQGGR